MWTWATYEAPPVLNLNLRGLFSRTDLMSLEAAGAEPAIVNFVRDGGESGYDSEVGDMSGLEEH